MPWLACGKINREEASLMLACQVYDCTLFTLHTSLHLIISHFHWLRTNSIDLIICVFFAFFSLALARFSSLVCECVSLLLFAKWVESQCAEWSNQNNYDRSELFCYHSLIYIHSKWMLLQHFNINQLSNWDDKKFLFIIDDTETVHCSMNSVQSEIIFVLKPGEKNKKNDVNVRCWTEFFQRKLTWRRWNI